MRNYRSLALGILFIDMALLWFSPIGDMAMAKLNLPSAEKINAAINVVIAAFGISGVLLTCREALRRTR